MEIIGYAHTEIDKHLINYTLSLFEGMQTKMIDQKSLLLSQNNIALIVLSCKKTQKELEETNSILFLVSCSDNSIKNTPNSYYLPNFEQNFDLKKGIIQPVSLRLELIRKVNTIIYKQLDIKAKKSSCGIERNSIECGDESDY
jgi:hypothetical protein